MEAIAKMNDSSREARLAAVRETSMGLRREVWAPGAVEYVNNHIHTTYSFSPYSPAMAAYKAVEAGLGTAGIMDHDSVAGAAEFIEAARALQLAHTVGFECRCRMDGTPFEGLRINNPDQTSVAYLAMHGIPHQHIERAQAFLTPYREKRNVRNRAMVARLNEKMAPQGITLDFDRDVTPLSMAADGGSITERHILYALARRMLDAFGRGAALVTALRQAGVQIGASQEARLMDVDGDWYDYHLLGILKAEMVAAFYIDATDECPHVRDFVALAKELGAVAAYAYLGDVQNSVTGDKKNQAFEDAYLDDLVRWLAEVGFHAVTFMPSRNTKAQLARVMGLCRTHGLFQISGEDINSPFQSFLCKQLAEPEYAHLVEATWALIGHEMAATQELSAGMFTAQTMQAMPSLEARIRHFAALGRAAYAQED